MANYWYIKFNWCDEKQINLEEINYFWRRHWLQGSRALSKIGSVPESGSTLVGSNKTIAGGPYRAPFSVILQNQSPAIDKIISIRLYVLYLELLSHIKNWCRHGDGAWGCLNLEEIPVCCRSACLYRADVCWGFRQITGMSLMGVDHS